MQILFISQACDHEKANEIQFTQTKQQINAAPKFFLLLIQGIAQLPNTHVTSISMLPVSPKTNSKKHWEAEVKKASAQMTFVYPELHNAGISRYIHQRSEVLKQTKLWLEENAHESEKAIIVDPIIAHVTIPIRRYAQKHRCKVIDVLTDVPSVWMTMGKYQKAKIKKILLEIYNGISTRDIARYDGHVFLTHQMNDVVNPKKRPYIVVEGCTDITLQTEKNTLEKKTHPRIVMYAGGIHAVFGIEKLVKAFILSDIPNTELHIYGTGSYVDELKKIMSEHEEVKYMGVVSQAGIIKLEMQATLMVNPRPITDEYTKYSFPSKTLEYMSSGTPMLSTVLPGIPKEYEEYLYWLQETSVEEIKNTLCEVLSKSDEELHSFGEKAKKFALEKKSNVAQGQRIRKFIISDMEKTL